MTHLAFAQWCCWEGSGGRPHHHLVPGSTRNPPSYFCENSVQNTGTVFINKDKLKGKLLQKFWLTEGEILELWQCG